MNPLHHLEKYNIVLGSGSPRRKELMEGFGIPFSIQVSHEDEIIPEGIQAEAAPIYLAIEKAKHIVKGLADGYLLITADTVVIQGSTILGKPKDRQDAVEMLGMLSDDYHLVVTGVYVTDGHQSESITDITKVKIAEMSQTEIEWYIDHHEVMDKAGSYGVQDWMGITKVIGLEGSYYNVMGLPSDKLYDVLKNW